MQNQITTAVEHEIKLTVTKDTVIPDLTEISYCTQQLEPTIHHLSAHYYDTADLSLTRAKITLRKRTGGKDDGWHIKLPHKLNRLELHHRIINGEKDIPATLLKQVDHITKGAKLLAIAQINNERHETLLADANGDILAEFCDDHVTASCFLPHGSDSTWREWELETTNTALKQDIAVQLLDSATKILTQTGAQPAQSPSKLLRALGDSYQYVISQQNN
ncbi:CYTH domain-containing protein [Corynebacterium kutscheri]|nr:CYTH domain-containing protein [Corynebacterium kutscheri]